MNHSRVFILLCAILLSAHPLSAQEGWLSSGFEGPIEPVPFTPELGGSSDATMANLIHPLPSLSTPAPSEIVASGLNLSNAPDEITSAISDLARGLLFDWEQIFLFVANELDYEHYYGCKKGAHLTLLERRGNDADLAALTVALLRAAGYSARYQSGVLAMNWTDPTGYGMGNWLGVTELHAPTYTKRRGFPESYQTGSVHGFRRVWPQVQIAGLWRNLDPAYKWRTRVLPTLNVGTVSGYSRSALITASGITAGSNPDRASGSQSGLDNYLTERANALLTSIQANNHAADALSITGGWKTEPCILAGGGQLLFPGVIQSQLEGGVVTYTSLPASLLTTVKFEILSSSDVVKDTSIQPFAALQGRRLSLTFVNSVAKLWLDDTLLADEGTSSGGGLVKLRITVDHPHSNSISATLNDQQTVREYTRDNAYAYAIIYGFNPSGELLRTRQEKLDAYRRSGLADTSREVVTETLNVLGQTWLHQTELAERAFGGMHGLDVLSHHRIGRVGQEGGYYVDVETQFGGTEPMDGDAAKRNREFDISTSIRSAMEHGVLEQTQGGSATSTMKLIKLGLPTTAFPVTGGVYRATLANWMQVQGLLTGYAQTDLDDIGAAISTGGSVLLPQKGNLALNQWRGAGYLARSTTGGNNAISAKISGGYFGGFNSTPGPLSVPSIIGFGWGNPFFRNSNPYSLTPPMSAEPIDLASGDYYYDATDLDLGSAAPRGLSLSRQYHGKRRFENPTGLGYGWTHSYHARATLRTAYEPAFGVGGTAMDTAAFLVWAHASMDLAAIAPETAQSWALSALCANWMTDQLRDNAASFNVGTRVMQFTKAPDGTWLPPGGSTMSLTKPTAGWRMQERHGNAYQFDTTGRLAEIKDLWGKKLIVSYVNDRVSTVADAYGRTLIFTYTSGKLTGVADSTGRSVSYTQDAANDLTVFTDAESIADRYTYDTDHRITEFRNHANALIAFNVYNTAGRCIEQHSMGDTTRKWLYYYAPHRTIEQDPLGGLTGYIFDRKKRTVGEFDRKKRTVGEFDGLFRYSATVYDGQDRPTSTTSPEGRTTSRVIDRYQNTTSVAHPGGITESWHYNANHLVDIHTNPRGFQTNQHAYNAKFQLTHVYDRGLIKDYAFHPTTGTLTSATTEFVGTDSFLYNTRDELETTTHRGSTETTVTLRDMRGNLTSITDRRGKVTGITYNNRRQPRIVTRPDLTTTETTYNNQRLPYSEKDGKGYLTYFHYNAAAKPTTTTLPVVTTMPPTAVITNDYDLRDWLETVENPMGHTTTHFLDAAGQLYGITDPLGRPTGFQYTDDGLLKETSNAVTPPRSILYNSRGLPETTTDAMQRTSSFLYNENGARKRFTNRRNKAWNFTYSARDYPQDTTRPTGRTSIEGYDGLGRLTSLREPSTQTTNLNYNGKDYLQSRVDPIGTTVYVPDPNGNPLTVTENGVTITRTFDDLNRVLTYNDGRGHTLGYTYDDNGNLETLTYEPGKTVTYGYDSRNRLTSVLDWAGRTTAFAYDPANRLTTLTRPNGTVRTHLWNDAGQLTRATDRHTASGQLITSIQPRYDDAGRLTSKLELPAWPVQAARPAATMTFNDDNLLATYNGSGVAHDVDGNMTSGPNYSNTGFTSYGWNARNQLTSHSGVTITYDAEGQRTSILDGSQTTTFVTDPHAALSRLLWRDKTGYGRRFFIYAGNTLLYDIDELPGLVNYYHYDHIGNTIALTDASGTITGRATYSAYGERTATTGVFDTPFQWQGAHGVQTDPTGLIYMRARYYHAKLGRFISEDPLGLAAGPNAYQYAGGNPIMAIDPSGLRGNWVNYSGGFVHDTVWAGPLNTLAGGWDALGDMGNAILHPVNTAKGIGNQVAWEAKYLASDPVGYSQWAAGTVKNGAVSVMSDPHALGHFTASVGVGYGAGRVAGIAGSSAKLPPPSSPRLGSLTPSEARLIQAFTDKYGVDVNVVGSRAAGRATSVSDFDYVIQANAKIRHKAEYYLPRGLSGGANNRGIDIFRSPLDTSRPHIKFCPR